jgi:fibronectin-binding autotransporter adhesin
MGRHNGMSAGRGMASVTTSFAKARCLLTLAATGVVLIFVSFQQVNAATTMNLNSASYSQNFAGLGASSGTFSLSGWGVTAVGAGGTGVNYGTLTGTATSQAFSSGTPTGGAVYNWGDGTTTTDRALGFMTSNGYASPNGIVFGFTNSLSGTITALSLAFDYERYRINTSAASVGFLTSTDGTAWTSNSSGDSGAFATGTSSYTFMAQTVVSKSVNLTGLSIASGASYYLQWNFNTTGASSQGLGLDNFTLNATVSPYWDANGTAAGVGGSGTWDSASALFSTAVAGTDATTRAVGEVVIFAGTAGTVTLSGTVNANSGITFNTDGYSLAGGTALNLGGASAAVNTITTDSAVNAAIATDITGSTGLTKAGAGTLTFTGTKSYTGGTTTSGGTLQLGDGTTNGAVTGNVTNNAILAFNNGSDQTFSNDVSGSGALTKTATGVLTLTGTNTYAGKTTITGGFIAAGGESKFGNSPGSFTPDQITLNGGGIQSNGNINFSSNRGLTLGAGGGTFNAVGTDQITLTNGVTGSGALTKTGSGDLNIDGANTFTGGVVINEGRVRLGNAEALNASSPNSVTFGASAASTAVLELNGNNITVSGLNTNATPGTPVVENANGTSATLTVNNGTANTYAGTLQDGTGAGPLALAKSGTGTLTLSGSNTYSGGTTLKAGTLVAGSNSALGTADVGVAGGHLRAEAGVTVSNNLNILGSVTLASDSFENALSLFTGSGSGNSFKSGNSLSSDRPATSPLAFAGTYSLGVSNGTYTLTSSGTDTRGFSNLNLSLRLASFSLGSASNGVDVGDRVTLQVSPDGGTTWWTQGLVTGNSNASWAYGATGTVSRTYAASNAGTTQSGGGGNRTTDGYSTFSISSLPAASSLKVKIIMFNDNAAELWVIDAFSLSGTSPGGATIGGDHTSGTSTYAGTVALNNDVTLTAASGGATSFTNTINGAGAMTKTGAGIVVLSGTNGYTGLTTVNDGNLQVGSGGTGSTASGSTVSVNGSSAILSGSGTVHGASTVTSGQIKPGDSGGISVGTLTFGSDLTLTGASSAATRLSLQLAATSASSINDAAGLSTAIASGTLPSYITGQATSYEAENGTHDKLNITGTLNLNSGGSILVDNTSGYTFGFGDVFDLLDWASINLNGDGGGGFAAFDPGTDLVLPTLSGGLAFDTSLFATNGIIVVVLVPEPSRALLLVIGLAFALFKRQRPKSRRQARRCDTIVGWVGCSPATSCLSSGGLHLAPEQTFPATP